MHREVNSAWVSSVYVSYCACGEAGPIRQMMSHYMTPEDALRGDARTNVRDDASTPEAWLSDDPGSPQGTRVDVDDPASDHEPAAPRVEKFDVDFDRVIELARLARDADGYPEGVTLTAGEYFAIQALDSYVNDEVAYRQEEGRPRYEVWAVASMLLLVSLWIVRGGV